MDIKDVFKVNVGDPYEKRQALVEFFAEWREKRTNISAKLKGFNLAFDFKKGKLHQEMTNSPAKHGIQIKKNPTLTDLESAMNKTTAIVKDKTKLIELEKELESCDDIINNLREARMCLDRMIDDEMKHFSIETTTAVVEKTKTLAERKKEREANKNK